MYKLDNAHKDTCAKLIKEATVGTITTTYVGYLFDGEPLSDLAKCVIQRIVEDTSTGLTEISWASGTLTFDKVWGSRATYTYKSLISR